MPLPNTPPILLSSADLDSGFSADGRTSLSLDTDNATAQALAVQADGKYVIAGWRDAGGGNFDFTLLRLNSDGSPDATFSGDGLVSTALADNQKAYDVALQTDGGIVVVGQTGSGASVDIQIHRYTADGVLDTSFSGDGVQTTSLSDAGDLANAVAVQTDGRILVAGASGSKYALLRYLADGSLDTSFDTDGKYIGSFGSNTAEASAMALQSDGSILVAGYGWDGAQWSIGVARHLVSGALDTSVSIDGPAVISDGGSTAFAPDIHSIAVQTDGKILLAGYIPGTTELDKYDAILIRLNQDGSTDTTFGGGDGIATLNRSNWDKFSSVVVAADGKILVGGEDDIDLNNAVLARFNGDGTLDTSFGSTGIFSSLYAIGTSTIQDLALAPNGQVVAVGASYTGANEFGVLRLAGVIGDQIASADAAFSYTIPANAFHDADGDTLTLSAALASGSDLPTWLNFDAATGTFSGTPTDGDFGTLQVGVTANDGQASVTAGFQMEVSNEFIEALRTTEHARWNDDRPNGTPGTQVTFSFMTAAPDYAEGAESSTFAAMNDAQLAAVRQVLQTYQELAGLTFVEVDDSGDGGQLRFGTYEVIDGSDAAYAYFPGPTPTSGDVWVNRASTGNDTPVTGTYAYTTLVHEIGHALGLKHPGNYGQGEPPYLPAGVDNTLYTVMSYNTHPQLTGTGIRPVTPMLYDVAALQFLYGANPATRTGDDTYTFDPAALTLETIWDGGGNDTIDVSSFTYACSIDLRAGEYSAITGFGAESFAIAYGAVIENAIGGAGADTLTGNTSDNLLDGRNGVDVMAGGLGNDTYVVDHARDSITELAGQGTDSVQATLSWTLGAHLENLALTGTGHRSGTGNHLDNLFTGNADNNILDGGVGRDTLAGGLGDDRYVVDNVGDVIQESAGAGNDTILASISWTLGENLENLVLTGTRNLSGTGNDLDNHLTGNGGAYVLNGGNGADVLYGGSGNDTLTGGAGSDTFAFTTPLHGSRNVDTITDFISEVDKIELSSAIFTQMDFLNEPTTDAFFQLGATAQDANDRILYDQAVGSLYYDADGTGAIAAIRFAVLSSLPTLHYNDFIVA